MRIALLISGGGTTAEHIIRAARAGALPGVEPVLVIASRPDAPGIERTIAAGMNKDDVIVLRPGDFSDQATFGDAIIKACDARAVEFAGQYGWLAKTPKNVIEHFHGMMTNQHPGPLDPGRPDFGGPGMYGRRVHAARLYFVRKTNHDLWTEATAQRVAVEFDGGAVLARRQVPILPDDDVPALQARLLPVEHEVQIEVLKKFATGTVKELTRERPLIKAEELAILEEAKKAAIAQFPNG